MLTNNTRITVFCSKKQGRETFWFATVLDGVNYHGRDQVIVADKNVPARLFFAYSSLKSDKAGLVCLSFSETTFNSVQPF